MAVEAQNDLKIEKRVFFTCLVKGGFSFECHMCDWPAPCRAPQQEGGGPATLPAVEGPL